MISNRPLLGGQTLAVPRRSVSIFGSCLSGGHRRQQGMRGGSGKSLENNSAPIPDMHNEFRKKLYLLEKKERKEKNHRIHNLPVGRS